MQAFVIIKKCWNNNKCRCEFKELIDKCVYDKGCTWNPSNCECDVINHVILDSI